MLTPKVQLERRMILNSITMDITFDKPPFGWFDWRLKVAKALVFCAGWVLLVKTNFFEQAKAVDAED